MIEKIKNEKCNGCFACLNICPTNAISIMTNNEGFKFPLVDKKKCIKCKRCLNVCTVNNNSISSLNGKNPISYAVKVLDDDIRKKSSSGGFFTILALYVLKQEGFVFGVAFDSNFLVKHICIQNKKDLFKLQGSKYLQSEIDTSYIKVKEKLDEGKMVLFSGTPCQIGGLKNYLGKEYDNLITQEIICHGVPSPMVWKKYLSYMEDKNKSKVVDVSFRNKKDGWKNFSMYLKYQSGKEYFGNHNNDLYFKSFLDNLTLRQSCYNCHFKTVNRQSDFVLADFWGIENFDITFDYEMGASLVILYSEKAKKIFDEIDKNQINYCKVDFLESIKYNAAMLHSVKMNESRNAFIKLVDEKGFKMASKQYLKVPLKKRIKRFIKKIIKR